MIYSKLHSKDTNEDPKTSSIIGSILLLPDQIIYNIFNKACSPVTMPLNNNMITGFEFWPHWEDDSYNANYVEPDVIIHCDYRDILIEAKYSDTSGQYSEQWKKEITAYHKLYGTTKGLSFIALGGNDNYDFEEIDGIPIMKCSWTSLLMAVLSTRSQFETISFKDEHLSQTLRILKHIEKAFEAHGVYTVTPLCAECLIKHQVNTLNNKYLTFIR